MTGTRKVIWALAALTLIATLIAGVGMWWRARQQTAPYVVQSVRLMTVTEEYTQYQAAVINETDTIVASHTLTPDDIARVYQLVMNDPRCDHRIIRIDDQPRLGTICDAVVMTGVVDGPLSGQGNIYYFIKKNNVWERLPEEGSWIS